MVPSDTLGFIAGALTTGSLIPQVVRVFKLKSAYEISLLFTSLLLAGMIMWIVYGVFFSLPPVIFWNAIAAVLSSGLLYAKLRYGREPKPG